MGLRYTISRCELCIDIRHQALEDVSESLTSSRPGECRNQYLRSNAGVPIDPRNGKHTTQREFKEYEGGPPSREEWCR